MQRISKDELKNAQRIESLCQSGPVFVEDSVVVMDINHYENMMKSIQEAKILYKGLADLGANRVKDGEAVLKALKEKYAL